MSRRIAVGLQNQLYLSPRLIPIRWNKRPISNKNNYVPTMSIFCVRLYNFNNFPSSLLKWLNNQVCRCIILYLPAYGMHATFLCFTHRVSHFVFSTCRASFYKLGLSFVLYILHPIHITKALALEIKCI